MEDIVAILKEQGIFNIKDGSAQLFFDDVGLLQKIIICKKRRKRSGEDLKIFPVKNGTSITNYDSEGVIQKITYETHWNRK